MKKDEFYCTVIYPITITKQALLQHGEITEEQYNGLVEEAKQELILSLADYFLTSGSADALITECIDEELND